MKDFLNHELAVGDLFVMIKTRKGGGDLHFGRVMGFTAKMVKVDYIRGWSKNYSLDTQTKDSSGIVKILSITPEVQVWLDLLNRFCVERLKKEPV